MVAVGLCSAMLVSSLNVFADSGSGGGSEIVNEGIETPGGADLNAKYRNPQVDTSENVEENTETQDPMGTTEDVDSSGDNGGNVLEEPTPEAEQPNSEDATAEKPTEEPQEEQQEQGTTDEETNKEVPADGETGSYGYLDLSRELTDGISTFNLNNSASNVPMNNEQYKYFAWSLTDAGTPSCPGTGIGIKYIAGDGDWVDAEGKSRLVYCLKFDGDSPWGNMPMNFQGWTNRKIAYALFYGPVFWGETARWSPYSTGNWKFDYWVTQMAVHILNGEFTWDNVWYALFGKTTVGGATHNDKVLVMDRLRTVVNDANNMANYSAFDAAGWIDFSKAVFNCTAPASNTGFWYDSGSNSYVLNGSFTPSLTMKDQDWRYQASYMNVNTTAGYINHWSSTTIHQFALHIPKADYEAYQRTGKDITVTVDAGIPKRWGGAIYKCAYNNAAGNKIQPVTFLSMESTGNVVPFRKQFTYHIPKTTGKVGVQKTSGNTAITNGNANYSLKGAVYTVYSDSGLSNVVGTITTDANGKGWLYDIPMGTYYVKETKASPGYELDKKTYTVSAEP